MNGQTADVVLGQPDFAGFLPQNLPGRFDKPSAARRDPTSGKVFVSLYGQNRILRFSNEAAAQSGSAPEAAFGQPNLDSYDLNQGGAAGRSTLARPARIFVDHLGRLWVAEQGSNRVLCWFDASLRGSGEQADLVFGQPDFISTANGRESWEMSSPGGIWVTPADVLWVADSDNNRILRFDNVSNKPSGAAADAVLGQPGFGSNARGTSASSLDTPVSVSIDRDGRLWVADLFNSRVLRFDDAGNLPNGSPASAVLGQPDFTSNAIDPPSATSLQYPYDVYPAPDGILWVADYGNGRVLGFPGESTLATGAAASFVLGQGDFSSTGLAVDEARMLGPISVSEGPGGSLLVADFDAHRVLRFTPFRTPRVRFARARATSRRPSYIARGFATGVVTEVRYRIGRSAFRSATGTSSWRARVRLRAGRNVLLVRALGPGGASEVARQTVTYLPPRSRRRR